MTGSKRLQYLQWLWDATAKPVITRSYPPIVYIETTNACNLRCEHCARYMTKRGYSYLSRERFEHILSEIEGFAKVVYLFKQGESLLNKDTPYFIKRLREKNIYVIMNTNATLLNDQMARKLIHSGISLIEFSIDSWKVDAYEKIRLGAKFKDVAQNVLRFLKLKEDLEPGIMTRVRMVEQDMNREELPRTVELLRQFPFDDIRINKLLNFFGRMKGEVEGEDTIRTKKDVCSYPWKVISITAEGALTCILDCYNIYPYGNIFEKPIKEIWNDAPMVKVREAFLSGSLERLKSVGEDYCYICNARLKKDQKEPTDFAAAFCSYGHKFPDYYMPHLRMKRSRKEESVIAEKYSRFNETLRDSKDYNGVDLVL